MGESILTEPRGKPNKETGQTKNATINNLRHAKFLYQLGLSRSRVILL